MVNKNSVRTITYSDDEYDDKVFAVEEYSLGGGWISHSEFFADNLHAFNEGIFERVVEEKIRKFTIPAPSKYLGK